jgi:hypothetical protein
MLTLTLTHLHHNPGALGPAFQRQAFSSDLHLIHNAAIQAAIVTSMQRHILRSTQCFSSSISQRAPNYTHSLSRHFQTTGRSYLWGKQILHHEPKKAENSSPKPLFQGPPTSGSKLLALETSLATRLSTDREIQCTEFDEKGEIVMGHGHIKKSDIVKKVGEPSCYCRATYSCFIPVLYSSSRPSEDRRVSTASYPR